MAKTVMGKTRKADDPYLVFQSGDWTWKVLKGYGGDDSKQYSRWFCDVSSPFTYGGSDLGDTYVHDVVTHARLTYADPSVFPDGFTIPTPPASDF